MLNCIKRTSMKTFQQYINEKENLDEGVRDYIKAGLTAAAMALSNQGTQAQEPTQTKDITHTEKLADYAKKNTLHVDHYIDEVLSTGLNLFKGTKNIDGYEVTISTGSGSSNKGGFGGKPSQFEPKENDPNTLHNRMDFKVELHGDNVKNLTREQAVIIARKAVNELNNLNQTVLGALPYKPRFTTQGTESWNKPYLNKNNQKNKANLIVAAFGEIPLLKK